MNATQGSEAWRLERAGCVTASRISDVLARIKSGEAAARRDYKTEIVIERLTGKPYENGFINAEMQHGIDFEPLARAAYEVHHDVMVDQVGFIQHPRMERSGASSDGFVGKDGLVEIKCPKSATHLQYLLGGEVPAKYHPQILWQLACTERAWADFVSYDPRLPPHLQLFVVRFPRDDKRITGITAEVDIFLREVDEIIDRLNRKAS